MHQIVMHIGVAQLYDFGVTLQCASSYIYFQPLDALHDYDLFVTFILQLVEAILLCSTCSCISYWWLHLLDFIGYAMIYRWLLQVRLSLFIFRASDYLFSGVRSIGEALSCQWFKISYFKVIPLIGQCSFGVTFILLYSSKVLLLGYSSALF